MKKSKKTVLESVMLRLSGTYTKDSALMLRLRKSLSKLSIVSLCQLDVVLLSHGLRKKCSYCGEEIEVATCYKCNIKPQPFNETVRRHKEWFDNFVCIDCGHNMLSNPVESGVGKRKETLDCRVCTECGNLYTLDKDGTVVQI